MKWHLYTNSQATVTVAPWSTFHAKVSTAILEPCSNTLAYPPQGSDAERPLPSAVHHCMSVITSAKPLAEEDTHDKVTAAWTQ